MIDIAVERCRQCIDAFPDLDELQLISTEGTSWRPKPGQSYEAELQRLAEKFGLTQEMIDHEAVFSCHDYRYGDCCRQRLMPIWLLGRRRGQTNTRSGEKVSQVAWLQFR